MPLSVLADEAMYETSSMMKQVQSVLLKVRVVMMPLRLEMGANGACLGWKASSFGVRVLLYGCTQAVKKD